MRRWSVVLLLVLAGCGGGKEILPESATVKQSTLDSDEAEGAKLARAKKPKKPKKLSEVTKKLRAGDVWIYAGTGTATNHNTGETVPLTIEATVRILGTKVASPQNVLCKVKQLSLVLTARTSAFALVETYFTQDANGNVFYHGEKDLEGNVRWITTPASGMVLDIKSPMQVGDGWGFRPPPSDDVGSHKVKWDGETVGFSDGAREMWIHVVERIETVRLTGAAYRAFLSTEVWGWNRTFSVWAWYVPAVGADVRRIGSVTDTQPWVTISSDISLTPQGRGAEWYVLGGQEDTELKRWAQLVLQILQR